MSHSSGIYETEVDLEPLTPDEPGSPNDYLSKVSLSGTVQQTVHRGVELRDQKPRNVQTHKQPKVRLVSANARGPCDPPNSKSTRKPRSKIPVTVQLPRSSAPCPSHISSSSRLRSQSSIKCENRSVSRGRREKCPLRIAELAEPSKRHCLNTWRDLPDTLPDHMLDRLQQRIMDQRPVVELEEAINYFQIRGRKKRMSKQKRQFREEATDQEIKVLCAVFARSIAQQLMKPINTKNVIATEMVNLVNIISSEISKVLKNRQIRTIESTSDNKTIQLEVAAKIAMWIEGILKDTGDRMLENELRAKVNKERRMGKEGHITTLIEKYLYYDYKDRDLEEEEGPVLDILDELFENVMVELSSVSTTNVGNELGDGGDDNVADEHSSEGAEKFGDGDDDKTDEQSSEGAPEIGDGGDDKIMGERSSQGGATFGDGDDEKIMDDQSSEGVPEFGDDFGDGSNDQVKDGRSSKGAAKLEDIGDNEITDNQSPESRMDQDPDMGTSGVRDTKTDSSNNTEENVHTKDIDKETVEKLVEKTDMLRPENANKSEENEQPKEQINYPEDNDIRDNLNVEQVGINVNIEKLSGTHNFDDRPPSQMSVMDMKDNLDVDQIGNNANIEKPSGTLNVDDKPSALMSVATELEDKLDVKKVGISANIKEPSGTRNVEDGPTSQISLTTDVNEDPMDICKDDRKVTFTQRSRKNLDPDSGELGQNAERSSSIEEKKMDSWNRALDNVTSDIIFAPPNLGLLSDADESWPDQYSHGIGLKLSESVSKSITSLGLIEENDETLDKIFNENVGQDQKRPEDSSALKYFTKPDCEERPNKERTYEYIVTKPFETTKGNGGEKLVLASTRNMSAIVPDLQVTRKNNYNEDEATEVKYVTPLFKVEIKKKASLAKPNDLTAIKIVEDNTKLESTISSGSSRGHCTLHTCSINDCAKDCFYNIDEGINEKCVINHNKSTTFTNTNICSATASKKNLIYQVPASNRKVPHRCDTLSRSSTLPVKIRQREAQRWCNDLERTVDNLYHWYKWIGDVCNKLMLLQQKSAPPCTDVKILAIVKEWIELKTDIENDAFLWSKLRKQTEIALQSYRKNSKANKKKDVPKYQISGRNAIFNMCLDIDGLTMWMDSLVTTTENLHEM